MPPGHTAIVEENLKMIEFSATKKFGEVIEHIGKKMAELGYVSITSSSGDK